MSDTEENVEIWKFKRIIKGLDAARGNGTSMISLIIPPKKQLSEVAKMLGEEEGAATNIKSRVNRLSVLSAITSAQQKLKLYTRIPKNGLVIFSGTAMTEDFKEKKLSIDFEPFKPVNTFLYRCASKFYTEPLIELLESDAKFGFIVVDGNGALFGTLAGNTREILHRFSVELPKKHGRGGQSALRFARLREEKRHNYVRKVAESAVQHFIVSDRVTVTGLILAGSADFKTELGQSDMLDKRLKAAVIKEVDICYGGEKGFNQAIELSAEFLQNVKFIQEKRLLTKFFDEIMMDSGKYCYGIADTLMGLEQGAVETLILWENLQYTRYVFRVPGSDELLIKHLNAEDEKKRESFESNGQQLETIETQPLIEWFAEHYKEYGTVLEIVTNKSQEGSQFVKGFGGIGGLLRYQVDFTVEYDENDLVEDEYI